MGFTRKFQRAFGRSTQTRILDVIWHRRKTGISVTEITRAIGVSYYYVVVLLPRLEKRGLIMRQRQGRRSIVRPNPRSKIIREVESWKR